MEVKKPHSLVFLIITKILVGDGATSVVVKACRNKDLNDSVAIKKVKRVFEHTAFAHRAMRELRLLRCLGFHENVSVPLKNANFENR
jgi:hypothetical protein